MTEDPKTGTITVPSSEPGEPPKVYSPSPEPGEPMRQRRVEDTKSYSVEWTILLVAALTWAGTFLGEIAVLESWDELTTPRMVGVHLGQLVGYIVTAITAKRIR